MPYRDPFQSLPPPEDRAVGVKVRVRSSGVDVSRLLEVMSWTLQQRLRCPAYQVDVSIVGGAEMARVNWEYLQIGRAHV